ncbi:MAG: HAD family hydrolase [Micavibrio aeruginosavorus]|uniref:HAD family hydrolase n=1 Tax=Micavibrio aeruginosavorus TaxID=349221 RepID=A0A2W5BVR6_9BACT|nr:MAG: HAD family hydrolase [Micavibrio aeruginosavorus]
MGMNNFDLIIFDCDGTLTDSEYLNNKALLDVLHEDGFTQYDLDHAYANWVGTTVSNILLSIQMETGRVPADDVVPRYIAKVAEMQHTHLKPIEGAADLIAAAAKLGKICVASNGERTNVVHSLELTGLMQYFTPETVFTKIQVKNPKPYPDLFLFAASQMDVPPERCLVIEDSAAGTRAGVAAGMTTWGFTGSSHDLEKHENTLKSAGADRIFPRLIHMIDALAH